MTRDQIITALFKGKNFNQCIGKMEPEHLRDDLKMEVMAIVCEWTEERILGLYSRGELEYFVVRVILNQIQSNTSPFYRKYRSVILGYIEDVGDAAENLSTARQRHFANVVLRANEAMRTTTEEEIEERREREEAEERALAGVHELDWYDAGMLQLYLKVGSYRGIEQETDIPFTSCYKTIQKAFKELKEKALCSTTI